MDGGSVVSSADAIGSTVDEKLSDLSGLSESIVCVFTCYNTDVILMATIAGRTFR